MTDTENTKTDNELLVSFEKRDRVAFITLNRPQRMNAINNGIAIALRQAWIEFEADDELRVAILTGKGKAFCAGMDLEEAGRGIIPDMNSCIPNIGVEVTKPVIAAINGWSIGAGMSLAANCDLRVASENVKFQFPEAKIGYSGGGLDLLRFMSHSIVMEYLLTGEPMEAKRAYEVGFVNRVAAQNKVMEEAVAFADKIKGNAPLVMKMRKMCNLEQTLSIKGKWDLLETRYLKPQVESDDFKEGKLAFKEKRKPDFKGR